MPVSELQPYSRNRNKHPEDQIKRLAELIKFHGLRHPVIVSTLSNQVIAGNGRLEALKLLGATEIPADFQHFDSEDAEYTFSVSDNAVALWSELDLAGINADLSDLGPFDIDMLGMENFKVDVTELSEIENTSEELSESDFKDFQHECPKCGFCWDENKP